MILPPFKISFYIYDILKNKLSCELKNDDDDEKKTYIF